MLLLEQLIRKKGVSNVIRNRPANNATGRRIAAWLIPRSNRSPRAMIFVRKGMYVCKGR
jgi:hypothetical protein